MKPSISRLLTLLVFGLPIAAQALAYTGHHCVFVDASRRHYPSGHRAGFVEDRLGIGEDGMASSGQLIGNIFKRVEDGHSSGIGNFYADADARSLSGIDQAWQ